MNPTTKIGDGDMSDVALAGAIAVLRDAYPRQEFPAASVRLYARMLDDLDGIQVAEAVRRLVRRSRWLPSIAEIREEVAEAQEGLPSAAEAWSLAVGGTPRAQLPHIVVASIDAMGGRWTMLHADNQTALRAQFTRDYEERRTLAVQAAAGAIADTLLDRASERRLVQAAREIPAVDPERIAPRPVWRRVMLRTIGAPLPEPTDADKHDAILVLHEGGDDELAVEALRILDEAGQR